MSSCSPFCGCIFYISVVYFILLVLSFPPIIHLHIAFTYTPRLLVICILLFFSLRPGCLFTNCYQFSLHARGFVHLPIVFYYVLFICVLFSSFVLLPFPCVSALSCSLVSSVNYLVRRVSALAFSFACVSSVT